MSLLRQHVQTIHEWIDLVEEVVVVDSYSEDGTVEFLKEKFADHRIRFFDHPPGLYQSWNYGIQQLNAPYTYISTIGDGISREGLIHLVQAAETWLSDVVISPPTFINETGEPISPGIWPVHRIISALELKRHRHVDWPILFAFTWIYSPSAILGSSASNLYRTATLKANPFPTEFGTNGDGAWGMVNVMKIRLCVSPRCVSYFREHAKSYSLSEYIVEDMNKKILAAGFQAHKEAKNNFPEIKSESDRLKLDCLIEAAFAFQCSRTELNQHRELLWPWILNPAAWRARHYRIRAERKLTIIMNDIFKSMMDGNQYPKSKNSMDWMNLGKQYIVVNER